MAGKKTTIRGQQEPVCYIGPSFPGIIQKNTTFLGGLPKKAEELMEQEPYMRELLVPVSALAEKRKQLKESGELNLIYEKLKERRG